MGGIEKPPIFRTIIKKLNMEQIKLEKTENGFFALNNGRYFKVNEVTYQILQAKINGKPTEMISNEFGISIDEIEKIWNILNSKQVTDDKISKLILLIPSTINNFVGKTFKFICNKYIFLVVSLFFIITLAYYFMFDDFKLLYANIGIIDYLIALFLTIIIHEYGHIVTAYYRNIKNLNIYLGFFIIFPTFYTKMNDLVTKSFRQRLLVNFGGIYFQMTSFVVFYIIFLFYNSEFIQLFLSIDLIIILINIIPFYFTDGYWLYADFFEIENLNAKSSTLLSNFFRLNFKDANRSRPLLLYTIFKSFVSIFIFGYILFFLYNQSYYIGDTLSQIKESNGSIMVILRCFLLLFPYILFGLYIIKKIYYGYKRHYK
jgi:putative peptide zinc metalloprotease protein